MKKVLFSFIILLVAFSMVLVVPVSADRGWIDVADKEPVKDYAYSFVVIGDTQIICYNDATKGTNYMDTLYSWIVENKEPYHHLEPPQLPLTSRCSKHLR